MPYVTDFSQIRVAQSLIVCVVFCEPLFFVFLLSFSYGNFIGLLYFIDDVDKTVAQICQSFETLDL